MRILLVDPPWIIQNNENLWRSVRSCLPSLGLAYVASSLEAAGHRVSYLDCTAEHVSVEAAKARLAAMDPAPDLVGLTATTPLFPNALSIAKAAKELFPGCRVVFGGVHATVMPDEVLSYPFVDYVARDEGEATAVELASGRAPEEILGLSWRRADGQIVHNELRPLLKDVDRIPVPAYHLLPMHRYAPAVGGFLRLPAMSLFATRGCPGRCTFCHRTFRGKVRRRSARSIVDEILLLQRGWGIREVAFYDDTFTAFKSTVLEFCEILVREKVDLTWSCFTRVDHVEKSLLQAMRRAGCHLILFGVESANAQILKTIRKNISLEQARQAVRVARELGIRTRASFMLGNPGETVDTLEETVRFAIELDPDQVQFNITTVYPGTEMYDWAKEHGYLVVDDWSRYNVSDVVMELPTVSSAEVRRCYRLAHKRFYLRPKVVLRRLLQLRTPDQLLQEIKGALAVVSS
jgi:radical SAM superfamily enzyme YgiQ (UPF0313 family)